MPPNGLKRVIAYILINIEKDMSLSNLIDNILQIARNNNISESEQLSRHQIQLWINYYRAMLIKRDLDRGYDIDESYISTIEPIHVDAIGTSYGKIQYVGNVTLPETIAGHYRSGVVCVRDMYGNIIQLGDQTKAKYQKYRQATCKDYIAWVKNNKVYVEGDSNLLEYISVDIIAEDPTSLGDCFDPDDDYPVPQAKIPEITQMILQNELATMITRSSDTTNDSRDDIQNITQITRKGGI